MSEGYGNCDGCGTPPSLLEQAATIGISHGRIVTIDCDTNTDAIAIFEWLEGISLNANEISDLPATSGIMEISAALRNIASFGKRHPGHGYTCARMAEQALAGQYRDTDIGGRQLDNGDRLVSGVSGGGPIMCQDGEMRQTPTPH